VEEWEASIKAELSPPSLPSDRASSKPEARIGLLLESKKSVGD
jgi:hypothetical protein